MKVSRRFVVRGRVQGVGFRYFVVQRAQEFGIEGTVRNTPDGSVEVVAQGLESSMAALREALKRGPSQANVAKVEEYEIQVSDGVRGFELMF